MPACRSKAKSLIVGILADARILVDLVMRNRKDKASCPPGNNLQGSVDNAVLILALWFGESPHQPIQVPESITFESQLFFSFHEDIFQPLGSGGSIAGEGRISDLS